MWLSLFLTIVSLASLTLVSQQRENITDVKSIAERLKDAREKTGLTQPELAAKAGVSPGTIGNIESGARKRPRELLAIAAAVGVRPEWLQSGKGPRQVVGESVAEDGIEYVGLARAPTLLPVAGTAQLGVNGWYEEVQAVGADGYVECHSSDRNAYALRVRGSSMHPAIRDRWFVIVEPNAALSSGEYVAIELKDGRKMVKEFLFRGAEAVTVESVNGGERIVLDLQDIRTIHAVGDIVPPSKHRNV